MRINDLTYEDPQTLSDKLQAILTQQPLPSLSIATITVTCINTMSCVALSKLLNFSEPQFPHLY